MSTTPTHTSTGCPYCNGGPGTKDPHADTCPTRHPQPGPPTITINLGTVSSLVLDELTVHPEARVRYAVYVEQRRRSSS